jgi:hypothetical protein
MKYGDQAKKKQTNKQTNGKREKKKEKINWMITWIEGKEKTKRAVGGNDDDQEV